MKIVDGLRMQGPRAGAFGKVGIKIWQQVKLISTITEFPGSSF